MKRIFLICIGIILFFSGVSYAVDTLTVTSPNGGERWKIGSTHNITWNHSGLTGSVMITLHRGGISTVPVVSIANSIPASLNTYRWTIPAVRNNGQPLTPASDYKILVRRNTTPVDSSNSNFTILSQSSLPNVLQHRQIGTPKQRIQATRPAAQRAPARTTRQQAKINRLAQLVNTSSPDLQINTLQIAPSNPTVHTRPLQCRIYIVNRGKKASSPCILQLKIETDHENKHYSFTKQINLPAIPPTSTSIQKTFDYYLFLSASASPPENKIPGNYTNTVTIDPARTSGERGIARLNNTKTLQYNVGSPQLSGCILDWYLTGPLRAQIVNVGDGVMPLSWVRLRVKSHFCGDDVVWNKTYKRRQFGLEPGQSKIIEFNINKYNEMESVLELCRESPDSTIEFFLDIDPYNVSYASRADELVKVTKKAINMGIWLIDFYECTSNFPYNY